MSSSQSPPASGPGPGSPAGSPKNGRRPSTVGPGGVGSKVALGAVRCYWSMMDRNLRFIFLDPVLRNHMSNEADLMLTTSLLDYIHPDEHENLQNDLEQFMASSGMHKSEDGEGKTFEGGFSWQRSRSHGASSQLPISSVHTLTPQSDLKTGAKNQVHANLGSVTKCRFSRVPRIRRILGCPDPPTDPEAHKYVLDDEFIPVKLVISWIVDGVLMCFFHAIRDKNETADNDNSGKSQWTNWCGPRNVQASDYLTPEICSEIQKALSASAIDSSRRSPYSPPGPGPPFSSPDPSKDYPGSSTAPSHVFQILDGTDSSVLVTFPPVDSEASSSATSFRGSDGEKAIARGYDYEPDEYAALARDVCNRPRESTQANSSCTRRYRSKHPVMKNGILVTTESVVIMYGVLTFACFAAGDVYMSSNHSTSQDSRKRAAERASLLSDESSQFELTVKKARSHIMPPISASHPDGAPPDPYAPPPSRHLSSSGRVSPTMVSASAILGSLNQNQSSKNYPGSVGSGYGSTYSPPEHQHQSVEFPSLSSSSLHHSNSHGYSSGSSGTSPPSFDLFDPHQDQSFSAPANFQTARMGLPAFSAGHLSNFPPLSFGSNVDAPTTGISDLSLSSSSHHPRPPTLRNSSNDQGDKAGSSAQTAGPSAAAPPAKKACASCGTTVSPEWRRGPGGVKSLCNACGLRYSRSQARRNNMKKAEESGADNAISFGKSQSKRPGQVEDQRGAAPAGRHAVQMSTTLSHTTSLPPLSALQDMPHSFVPSSNHRHDMRHSESFQSSSPYQYGSTMPGRSLPSMSRPPRSDYDVQPPNFQNQNSSSIPSAHHFMPPSFDAPMQDRWSGPSDQHLNQPMHGQAYGDQAMSGPYDQSPWHLGEGTIKSEMGDE